MERRTRTPPRIQRITQNICTRQVQFTTPHSPNCSSGGSRLQTHRHAHLEIHAGQQVATLNQDLHHGSGAGCGLGSTPLEIVQQEELECSVSGSPQLTNVEPKDVDCGIGYGSGACLT